MSTKSNIINIYLFVFRWLIIFVLFFIFTSPFDQPFIPASHQWLQPVLNPLIDLIGKLFNIKYEFSKDLASDSTSWYLLGFFWIILSGMISVCWSFFEKKNYHYNWLFGCFIVGISYYLSLALGTYGLSKVFKHQFYLAEPNLLYTPLGEISPDLLFWTSMGTSHSYNIFMGGLECFAACLLLFRKTRFWGGVVALGVLSNILAINFCFDISVKLYSSFLLLLSILIVLGHSGSTDFDILYKIKPGIALKEFYGKYFNKTIYRILKIGIIGFLVLNLFYPYYYTGNYNDDAAPRPAFHGAYDIPVFIINGDTIPSLLTDQRRWKKAFVHRRGYFIIQAMNDQMKDYKFEADTIRKIWILEDYTNGVKIDFNYKKINEDEILLERITSKDSIKIYLNKINIEQLPIRQKDFHWTIDTYN